MDRIMDIIYTKSEKKTKRFQVDWWEYKLLPTEVTGICNKHPGRSVVRPF